MKAVSVVAALAASAIAAPAPDDTAHPKRTWFCENLGENCYEKLLDHDVPETCLAGCRWAMGISMALGMYNPIYLGMDTPERSIVPNIDSSKYPNPNNDTAQLYRYDICPKMDRYASCAQCIINNTVALQQNFTARKELVTNISNVLTDLGPYCQKLGGNASSYTAIVLGSGASSGAMTTVASATVLLVLGLGVASLV